MSLHGIQKALGHKPVVLLGGGNFVSFKKVVKVVRSLEPFPWRGCWDPCIFCPPAFHLAVNSTVFISVPSMMCWATRSPKNQAQEIVYRKLSQNKSFLFSNWWSQIFCYCTGKLINMCNKKKLWTWNVGRNCAQVPLDLLDFNDSDLTVLHKG